MKRIYITTLIALGIFTHSFAQEISEPLSEARTAYSAGNLDDARFALEQTLQKIDQAVGREILKLLPTDLSGMSYQESQDNVTGTSLGFAGLFVDRNYLAEGKDENIQIIGDSPLRAGLKAILAMPAVLTSGDENQKRIKVDGYKSLLQKDVSDTGVESYTIQIPANSTLITISCNGVNENEAIAMANQIPIGSIVKLAQ